MRPPILVALALLAVPLLGVVPTGLAANTLVVGTGPGEYGTIQAAVDAAQPGDLVFVRAGSYPEAVLVETPRITIRGESRASVVLEGGGFRGSGISVTADGVSLESMTAQNYAGNGFFFSDVDGFRMHDLYAKDNRVYGLYAIRSVNGDIGHSFAEGHGDGGIYIGQVVHCDCDVHHNVAWNNMLGYSGTANSYVRIYDNEFYDNRAGILLSVLPNEMDVEDDGTVRGTQVHTEVFGNYVHHNNNKLAPVAPGSTWETVHVPVGEGITIAGGWFNHVHHNILEENHLWGVGVFWLFTPPRANLVTDNTISGSRFGIWWDEWGEDHCFERNDISNVQVVSDPAPLPTCQHPQQLVECPPQLVDWASCRATDVRAPDPLKDAWLARRALLDLDPHED